MMVRDVMTRNLQTGRADDDLAKVGRTMLETRCGALPVLGAGGDLVGFLTDRDVCAYLSAKDVRPSEAKAADVMHTEVWACAPDHTVSEALAIMRRHHVRRLPVLNDANRLVGIVSIDDVVMSRPVVEPYDGAARPALVA